MDHYAGAIIIGASCVIVLLISAFRRKKEWVINFILRAVTGTVAAFFLNGFLVSQGISIAIGINPITVLTSGILGFPGLIALYGINLYALL
ncbi:pro-sigmaK processing inhibitor BofA family protein [Kineothrix sp. MB12-C1]|uniref:pro-sigmaK processing inhibitor BofA family protein n=1 Tax=Kineothrix sp. MB12-C1 TaxID=3070215 RepID=UPI0027D2360C|nr:pro-sigmaK processing inhibitor BofA family protein [Kineothrix sp. MB12-C1]WMC94351.1 pro-sigmaK processing inhibitor BofA family protein [Kineothrix sp. MB12-C1]